MKRIREDHGMCGTAVYISWYGMKTRCNNKRDKINYSNRGISYCSRWERFSNFYADMGDRPKGMSLDRVDNDKGYSPENCRWATRLQQNNNQRIRKDNKSGVRGVHWSINQKDWIVKFKSKNIGCFKSFNKAVKCRKKLELEKYNGGVQ